MKISVLAGALALVIAACLASVPVALAQSTAPFLVPTLHCVIYHRDTKVLDVFLGYTSTHAAPVTIPIAFGDNFFFPSPEDRHQPAVFHPGTHPVVFFTSFVVDPSGMQQLSWLLGASSVTARNDPALYCPPGVARDTVFQVAIPLPVAPAGSPGLPGTAGPPGRAGAGLGQHTVRTPSVQERDGSATASCAAGETVMGGGGSCGGRELKASMPTSNGWTVRCGARVTTVAIAVCVRP
jgi:hypothetical protein